MKCVLGVDVGGTSIKAGIFTLDGVRLNTTQFPTPQLVDKATFQIVCKGLDALVKSVSGAELVGIGLDCPGPISSQGELLLTANIELDLEGLKAALSSWFKGVPIAVLNDANAAALGEMWQGGAHKFSNFYMLAIGTGVGGGLVMDSKVACGAHGCGGEIGHVLVNYQEDSCCGCGRKGCLEQYASAPGIVAHYKKLVKEQGFCGVELKNSADSKAIFDAFLSGDAWAQAAIENMCDYLGRVLADIAVLINPEAFVIGGGVGEGFKVFVPILKEKFQAYCLPSVADTAFVKAELGNDAGSYGAAFEALRMVTEQ